MKQIDNCFFMCSGGDYECIGLVVKLKQKNSNSNHKLKVAPGKHS